MLNLHTSIARDASVVARPADARLGAHCCARHDRNFVHFDIWKGAVAAIYARCLARGRAAVAAAAAAAAAASD